MKFEWCGEKIEFRGLHYKLVTKFELISLLFMISSLWIENHFGYDAQSARYISASKTVLNENGTYG